MRAQTTAEWIKQKRTQTKYLLEQIAASTVYKRYIKSGYELMNSGLASLAKWKQGEQFLHRHFYDAEVAGMLPAVPQALLEQFRRLQKERLTHVNSLQRLIRQEHTLTRKEVEHIAAMSRRLMLQTREFQQRLLLLAKDGPRALNDQQRLQEIVSLLQEMASSNHLANRFYRDWKMMSTDRYRKQVESARLRKIQLSEERRP
ncbi:hypothetical protein GFH32_17015 [Sphingobacteruim zhuxiongii]|uniref:Uncharacterized protein n=1 Tax=Sphingobacterium zhuxiongii TaxID=2662364 RepID=A0A5Q0QIW7_9SPHI|nr:hypothetical protein GFH32_17015 [Sphingobacterium sp. dk4302]